MFKQVSNNNPFKEWLDVGALLEPQYDYFNFVESYKIDMRKSNSIYTSLLNGLLLRSKKKDHPPIVNALKLINVSVYSKKKSIHN